MARPEKIKTKLGQRLTDMRKAIGFFTRKNFADYLKMHPDTLGSYERGDSIPNANFLEMCQRNYSVNLNWLFTGEGEMFANAAAAPASMRTVDPFVMMKIASKIEDIYKDFAQTPTKAHITCVAAEVYNDMLANGTDLNDNDELMATITLEMVKLKKRIINGEITPEKATA